MTENQIFAFRNGSCERFCKRSELNAVYRFHCHSAKRAVARVKRNGVNRAFVLLVNAVIGRFRRVFEPSEFGRSDKVFSVRRPADKLQAFTRRNFVKAYLFPADAVMSDFNAAVAENHQTYEIGARRAAERVFFGTEGKFYFCRFVMNVHGAENYIVRKRNFFARADYNLIRRFYPVNRLAFETVEHVIIFAVIIDERHGDG